MEEENYQAEEIRQEEDRIGLIQNKFNQVKKKMDESAARFERRNRVTFTTVFLMLFVAATYDLLQIGFDLIPIIGWVLSSLIGVYSWLTFYTWTSINGWNSVTSEKMAVKWISRLKWVAKYLTPILALIPIVNSLPEITFGVLISILLVKSEDFVYNKTKGRVDEEIIEEGLAFFNLFREV